MEEKQWISYVYLTHAAGHGHQPLHCKGIDRVYPSSGFLYIASLPS